MTNRTLSVKSGKSVLAKSAKKNCQFELLGIKFKDLKENWKPSLVVHTVIPEPSAEDAGRGGPSDSGQPHWIRGCITQWWLATVSLVLLRFTTFQYVSLYDGIFQRPELRETRQTPPCFEATTLTSACIRLAPNSWVLAFPQGPTAGKQWRKPFCLSGVTGWAC